MGANPCKTHKLRGSEREKERSDSWGKDSHHSAWTPQWSVEAAVVCWGQVCGAVEIEQCPSTGGPDPNQPRNVEKEALGTMCSVPMPYWVPPASALFCFQAGENRKTSGLGSRIKNLSCSQLISTTSAQRLLQLFWSLSVQKSPIVPQPCKVNWTSKQCCTAPCWWKYLQHKLQLPQCAGYSTAKCKIKSNLNNLKHYNWNINIENISCYT